MNDGMEVLSQIGPHDFNQILVKCEGLMKKLNVKELGFASN